MFASTQTYDVSSYGSCNGGYCNCVTPGAAFVPYQQAANGIYMSKGYERASSFQTTYGPQGWHCYTYNGVSWSCFNNAYYGNLICTSVTCETTPPTCSVTVDSNPIAYGGSTTLHWTSSRADTSFYINNVGYVTPNTSGSATVGPLATTNYDATAVGPGGSVSCPRTLAVNAPSSCTFNGNTVAHGASITTYQAATVPYDLSCLSQSRTCSNGTLSGAYEYASCDVGPACSLFLNPTTVTQGQSSTLSWSSTNATSCTGVNFTTGGATSGNTSVAPSVPTTYTASCTGERGEAQCTGTGSGGTGALLSISCTPSYSCSGTGNQTIIYTDAACAQSTIDTCDLPEFCAAGSAICLYEAPTGNMTASPRLVASGGTSHISWTTTNAAACTVTGNGDTWTSASGTRTSNPITQYVTYTLTCDGEDPDSIQDDLTDSVSIYRVPSWLEL